MSPNDIKRIVNCVVDYGWSILIKMHRDENGAFTDQETRVTVFDIILDYLRTNPCRLDPTHIWDWPIESREGYPVWALCDGKYRNKGGRWMQFDSIEHARDYADGQIGVHGIDSIKHFVAPHPLNPTMEPPVNWQPEGRRILK